MALGHSRRQLNVALDAEVFDRVARAARKANLTRSAYGAAFIAANIDVIDPEGAAPAAPTGER